jgi:divinyl protochlorophyllide a 8-vinyl-reductase
MAEALARREGAAVCRQVFAAAGVSEHLDRPPVAMVDEAGVARLHREVMHRFGPHKAADIAWEAGTLTGDYLLANRIPRLAQFVLRHLPRALSARILVAAIARHAWTFSGSGRFSFTFDKALYMRIEGSPVCRLLTAQEPACHYFAATFERVFAAMLGPNVRVMETYCEASGADSCRFKVSW